MWNPFKSKPLLTVQGNTVETKYDQILPGLRKWDDAEDFYFQDSGQGECADQREILFKLENLPVPKEGSFFGLNCRVTTPDGLRFFAVQAFRDTVGWRRAIAFGAAHYGLLMADVIDDRFVLSDGRSFAVPDCKVEFWGPDDPPRNPPIPRPKKIRAAKKKGGKADPSS